MKSVVKVALVCVGVSAVLTFAVAACAVQVVSGFEWGEWNDNSRAKAERSESHALDFSGAKSLEVTLGCGSLAVRASSTETPGLSARITGHGKDDADAKRQLDATSLDIATDASGVRIGVRCTLEATFHGRSCVALELVVPKDTRLVLDTGSGSIKASGEAFADARIHSDYGSLAIRGVHGELVARSASGSVAVEACETTRCEVRSDYGSLTLRDISAGELDAQTQSGTVAAERLRATSVRLSSGYGSIRVADCQADLAASTSSGSVSASGLAGAKHSLHSDYGSIKVDGASGDLACDTSSGSIALAGVKGGITADSDYGSVRVDGIVSSLSARTSSGLITVNARPGSTFAGDWRVASSYGNVACELPGELAFDLAAKTNYGSVAVGFELAVPAGAPRSKQDVRGSVNGGGRRLELVTQSGNVSVKPSDR